jgi:hypothetical protein
VAPSVRALKLQLFYRLQARGPHGAWTRYWTGFQRFLAARIALEEFHALAREVLGDDMRTWAIACWGLSVRQLTARDIACGGSDRGQISTTSSWSHCLVWRTADGRAVVLLRRWKARRPVGDPTW